jgi:hypothetical protein
MSIQVTVGEKEYFPGIGRIPFEGPESDNLPSLIGTPCAEQESTPSASRRGRFPGRQTWIP